jgi:hypothetical protein
MTVAVPVGSPHQMLGQQEVAPAPSHLLRGPQRQRQRRRNPRRRHTSTRQVNTDHTPKSMVIAEVNIIQLVLSGMQNRTFGTYLAAINRIIISLMGSSHSSKFWSTIWLRPFTLGPLNKQIKIKAKPPPLSHTGRCGWQESKRHRTVLDWKIPLQNRAWFGPVSTRPLCGMVQRAMSFLFGSGLRI